MVLSVRVLGNIIAPTISGLFIFIYFLYFKLTKTAISISYKSFSIFLITFSIFLFGRPIQILLGPHPCPLIINNLRVLLFSSFCVPMVLYADLINSSKSKLKRGIIYILTGFFLGLTYSLFNILSTEGSYEFFRIGEITSYDILIPNFKPPFYGREVTIAVFMILGISLMLDSFIKIIQLIKFIKDKKAGFAKIIFYNIGKLIFGTTMILGSLAKQWWFYYVGSVASSIFLGYGIFIDIKESHIKLEKVISHIKEYLIQNISISPWAKNEVNEILNLLEKQKNINTFIIIKTDEQKIKKEKNLNINNVFSKIITYSLDLFIGNQNYIFMPLGMNLFGICLAVNKKDDKNYCINIAENIKEKIFDSTGHDVNIGVGRTYNKLEELKLSYHEALNALEYASLILEGQVIHIDDIQETKIKIKFPLREKEELLSAIRSDDDEKAIFSIKEFALMYVPASFVIGFFLGNLLANETLISAKISKTVFFLPLVIPLSMSSIMFLFILNPQWGPLNSFIKHILCMPELASDWMNNPDTALFFIAVVTIWQNIGFIALLFMVGIQNIPKSIREAAIIDGANYRIRLFHIILPSLRETYQIVGILSIVTSIKLFAQVIAMTGALSPIQSGGPAYSTLTMYVRTYQVAFGNYDMGLGATMGYLMAAIGLCLFGINFYLTKEKRT